MQTQNLKISEYGKNPLIMNNTQHPMMREWDMVDDSNEQSIQMAQTDPRWRFAARVQLILGSHLKIQNLGHYESLVESAERAGISGIHARAMICIVEDAQIRGGLDHQAMEQLSIIPLPIGGSQESMPDRLRWMTFGVLFVWAFAIAGMMQFV